ncbi:hypothetical protein [Bacillus toyonensis]|uniref:hypothetical protein n=1 Tax=Bacillus toyonensis TaxID=155322 RepID=UPI000BED9DA1|nr:hypothetical protein [Bacillus toyonensis]PED21686.1 hypothetical protein CON63_02280 [Bacillus toyonensis]
MMMLLNTEGLEEKINKQGKTAYFVDDGGEIVGKRCTGCEMDLPLEAYQVHKPYLGGRKSKCKRCTKVYEQNRKKKLKEKVEN